MKKMKLSLASIIITEIYYKRKRVDITEELNYQRVESPGAGIAILYYF